jgi:hypothetical protein
VLFSGLGPSPVSPDPVIAKNEPYFAWWSLQSQDDSTSTVVLRVSHDSCDEPLQAGVVQEDADAIRILVTARPTNDPACLPAGKFSTVSVHLDAPLAERALHGCAPTPGQVEKENCRTYVPG